MASSNAASAAGHGLVSGTVLQDKYVIEHALGAGGMGKIYLATQKPFNRQLVIKVMHDEQAESKTLVQRFSQEAQAVTQLSHPNTVTVFDFGQTEHGLLFIVMEYVEGVSLGRLIQETGALPLEEAVSFVAQIAQALGEAHHKGIIHRDLKPDNIMVVRSAATDPFVKVLDFGIAKLVNRNQEFTEAGSIVGTPAYMAPEQARNKVVDGRTDLYSLGCCMYEMLTGEAPYQQNTVVSMLLAHQNEPPPSLPSKFPVQLNGFLQKAMAKDPEDRPKTASDFVADMLNCFMGEPEPGEQLPGDSQEMMLEDKLRVLGAQTPPPAQLERFSHSATKPQFANSSGSKQPSQTSAPSLPRPRRRSKRPDRSTSPSVQRRDISLPAPGDGSGTQSSPIPFRDDISESATEQTSSTNESPPPFFQPENTDPEQVRSTVASAPDAAAPEYFEDTSSSGDTVNGQPAQPSPSQVDISAQQQAQRPTDGVGTEAAPDKVYPLADPRLRVVIIAIFAIGTIGAAALALTGGESETQTPVAQFSSSPEGATIYLDDIPVGITPLEQTMEAERIEEIRFEYRGYESARFEDFNISATGDNRLFAELSPKTIEVIVSSEVGGLVRINDREMGRVGIHDAESFALNWPGDDLVVTVEHSDLGMAYRRIAQSQLDQDLELSFSSQLFDDADGDPSVAQLPEDDTDE